MRLVMAMLCSFRISSRWPVAAAVLACSGVLCCLPGESAPGPRLDPSAGLLHVYLSPLSADADRIAFRLAEVSAVREDGSVVALSIVVKKIGGRSFRRERLLAGGPLPVGDYRGLQVRVESALLEGAKGEAELRVPSAPVQIEIPLTVRRRDGIVVTLRFRHQSSVRDGYRFTPDLSASAPPRLAAGLIAIASSRQSNTVTLFDKLSGQVMDVVPTGGGPGGIALAPSELRAYVAIRGDDAVETIDLMEGTVIDRRRLTGGDRPEMLALTLDGTMLLSANTGSDSVSFLSTEGLGEIDRVLVGLQPRAVVLQPDGLRAYSLNSGSSTVSVIDVSRRAVIGTIPTEAAPFRGEFNRNGDRLLVIHELAPFLTVIDPVTRTVVDRVRLDHPATALKVDVQTDRIYLAPKGGGRIDVYDPLSLLPLESIPTVGDVAYMAIDGETENLCIVEPRTRTVRVVGLVNKKTVAETDVGAGAFWAAVVGER